MAIQSMQLDPNAASYTDDEIVGKVNSAAANISRANAIESTAVDLSGKDADDIAESATKKYAGISGADFKKSVDTLEEITEGTTKKHFTDTEKTKLTGVEDNAKNDQSGDEIVTAINGGSSSITREDVLSQDDLKIVKTNPVTGEFQVKNIHRQADGKLDIEYDDQAEP